ncbi:MAG: hypothetical protein CMM75_10070 [Rhodospirillaceae bacterium]|nr:hypothetical protein [Rhodospirillaceae bacterium]
MDAQTLMVVFGFAWGAWIIYRIHKRRSSRAEPTASIVNKSKDQQAAMPRIGKPGTLTLEQRKELQENNFTPDNNWSQEEAALILDGVKYLRLVCSKISSQKDGDPPLEVQNALLKFILTEQDIRDHITKWGNDRRAGELGASPKIQLELIQNQQYERVKTEAQKYFTEQ